MANANVYWSPNTPIPAENAYGQCFVPVRIQGAAEDGTQDTFGQVLLGNIVSIQSIIDLLVVPINFTPLVELNNADQSTSLEFTKAWGQKFGPNVSFQISATARDNTGAQGPMTISGLPFYANDDSEIVLILEETGVSTGAVAVIRGDTIAFLVDGQPVQTSDIGANYAFRVTGLSIPVTSS